MSSVTVLVVRRMKYRAKKKYFETTAGAQPTTEQPVALIQLVYALVLLTRRRSHLAQDDTGCWFYKNHGMPPPLCFSSPSSNCRRPVAQTNELIPTTNTEKKTFVVALMADRLKPPYRTTRQQTAGRQTDTNVFNYARRTTVDAKHSFKCQGDDESTSGSKYTPKENFNR